MPQTQTQTSFECFFCQCSFASTSEREAHLNAAHPVNYSMMRLEEIRQSRYQFSCAICLVEVGSRVAFSDKLDLDAHISRWHRPHSYAA